MHRSFRDQTRMLPLLTLMSNEWADYDNLTVVKTPRRKPAALELPSKQRRGICITKGVVASGKMVPKLTTSTNLSLEQQPNPTEESSFCMPGFGGRVRHSPHPRDREAGTMALYDRGTNSRII